jgi:hypothetical protein
VLVVGGVVEEVIVEVGTELDGGVVVGGAVLDGGVVVAGTGAGTGGIVVSGATVVSAANVVGETELDGGVVVGAGKQLDTNATIRTVAMIEPKVRPESASAPLGPVLVRAAPRPQERLAIQRRSEDN